MDGNPWEAFTVQVGWRDRGEAKKKVKELAPDHDVLFLLKRCSWSDLWNGRLRVYVTGLPKNIDAFKEAAVKWSSSDEGGG